MAPAEAEDDDARHKREEAERRAKRKATKSSKKGISEKDRKRREHTQRVLNEQNKKKKPRVDDQVPLETSKFEALFKERSQGFVMEFAFRNAPPRPPVGPCFVGLGLDGQLLESSQYHPTVELNYTWKLHSEPDLGVPLAPSAMDNKCYEQQKDTPTTTTTALHPDDDALLNWTGSMGDTAAEQLKLKRDQARAAARLALKGKALPSAVTATATTSAMTQQPKKKKEFSRVLDESMQSWMKKTTYLANDYSRKVHDFTSLAKAKQKTAEELEAEQARLEEHRSAETISQSFVDVANQTPSASLRHPSKPHLKPTAVLPLLPNVQEWGHAYTHVVLDNPPRGEETENLEKQLDHAFVAHVQRQQQQATAAPMTCQVLVPKEDDDAAAHYYRPIQQYDLKVEPLREENAPHVHFAIWVGEHEATYLPISSRVLLSTGRPVRQQTANEITRRPASQQEQREWQERTSEVDADVAKALEKAPAAPSAAAATSNEGNQSSKSASSYNPMEIDDDSSDGDDDFDGGAAGTASAITAEG